MQTISFEPSGMKQLSMHRSKVEYESYKQEASMWEKQYGKSGRKSALLQSFNSLKKKLRNMITRTSTRATGRITEVADKEEQ